ncbi:helix-turn-helix transcriptional regulator [Flavobacterium capsici]|uniref:Helix-turn-helix domain-containing protein n=1 Tax=Flavobacterium capsici TaxID=3075618 RepID=A0AA96EWT6_9FLAO|nr:MULTISPECIES: helix-turn-helix domain-containing protein [unclassified Flavobacterium]WNM19492.1 helix-turn-helix domain-containing protein [Flavobacterium sp. PMR2A8]WNM20881.1 helix-turn-helix domain-containing protein [Flavobacterium sp. PMTSA4]
MKYWIYMGGNHFKSSFKLWQNFCIHVNKFVYICTMKSYLKKYKGIHPGIVLDRLLTKKAIPQRPFALAIGEHPQTINAITKGRRNLNTALALKIEDKLNLEEGSLALLQTYFEIEQEKKKTLNTPNLALLRKSLFWDTDTATINWQKQYKAIIRRVFERGNEEEKKEIERFYGSKKTITALQATKGKPYTIYRTKQPA